MSNSVKDDVISIMRNVSSLEEDLIALKAARANLSDREAYYKKLIEEGRFNKESMKKALSAMTIDQRKADDVIISTDAQIANFKRILNVLMEKV